VSSFTHLRCFKVAILILSFWNLRSTFWCTKFLIFSVTPMEMCYLSKLQIFILYLNKNITKIRDLFKGCGKNHQIAVVIIGRFRVLLFWAFVWVLRWFFLSLLIFSECWQLNTLSGHLAPNFIWGFLCSTHIIFVPSNISHSRKEVRNSFVEMIFFHREGIIIDQGVI
jgi:hypothetical protein